MGDLSCFLAQNALKTENETFIASKRFQDKNKNPIK